jgi:hypothetical protein
VEHSQGGGGVHAPRPCRCPAMKPVYLAHSVGRWAMWDHHRGGVGRSGCESPPTPPIESSVYRIVCANVSTQKSSAPSAMCAALSGGSKDLSASMCSIACFVPCALCWSVDRAADITDRILCAVFTQKSFVPSTLCAALSCGSKDLSASMCSIATPPVGKPILLEIHRRST